MSKNKYNLDNCTTCNTCNIHCPVMAVSDKFYGPKMSGPAGERLRLFADYKDETEYDSLKYCSNCKNCDISCPSMVPISTLNMIARAKYEETRKRSLNEWLLAHTEKIGEFGSIAPSILNLGQKLPFNGLFLEKSGIAKNAPLPKYASKTFKKLFYYIDQKKSTNKIVFYPGCFINYNEPNIGIDVVKVLNANGYEVILPENIVCCGSPLVVGGYLKEAEENIAKNINSLSKYIEKGYKIVTACTTCLLMLTVESLELFEVKDNNKIAENTYDVFEFLRELLEEGKLNTNFKQIKGEYLYHAPCHLRAKGIGKPALDVLNIFTELKVIDLNTACCGLSGSYGFKKENFEIALAIGENLFADIKERKIDVALSDCGPCRLQIGKFAKVKTMHPISLLAKAY